jgi:hypothetical protein
MFLNMLGRFLPFEPLWQSLLASLKKVDLETIFRIWQVIPLIQSVKGANFSLAGQGHVSLGQGEVTLG